MEDCFVPKKQRPFLFQLIAAGLLMLFAAAAHAQTTVDCSVSTNCSNAYCNYAANIERGCRCFDGLDNDGDGKIDKADSNCAAYYGLVFVGEGSNCSIVPPGTPDPFDLVNAPISSAQNTADTQSKVSVGDVDGDGIPDAVITSKWNSEIRVVATRAPQPDGTQAGAVKSDFNLSGNVANQMFSEAPNSGDCKPSRLLFEHENLIADIDKDGKAELFGIVSNRAGNPETPPTCFYLVAFKYAPGDLVPLFKAVSVGTDRPGTFGIADMDGDGKAEIYMRDRIYAAETGKLLAQAGGDWDLDVTSAPVAVNISGDTRMELVCGTKIYSIPSLTDRNPASVGSLTLLHDMNATSTDKCYVKLMNDPVEYGEDTHSSCSVADIDKDGNVDVVISGALNSVTGKTAVFYWNVAKNQVNYFLPPDAGNVNGWDWGTGRVNIGDANGDGNLDLSFISGNRLWCLKVDPTTGALSSLWASYRTINDSRSGVVTVTIYDFDNDGKPEMVYRDSQILAVIDGVTGSLPSAFEWSAPCQSHTYTEGPIIADVNGDGGTDICVACYTADNPIDVVKDGLQQQALGQFRLYYSAANDWLPTRKVWNQPGYFVVNIKDNLQLPFPQLDQNVIFGTGTCPNGIPGPQMPMNVFLNQVPFLSANGCPVFPAPDLSYIGDNPDNPGVDSNGDGAYTPAVEVVPPICGDLAIKVRFNIVNDGDLPISGNIPVSFFKADPTLASTTQADRLHTATLNVTNLAVDQTLTTAFETFNGTGGTFRLYIVLNNNGSTLPINLSGASTTECRIDNNIYSVNIAPDPFTTKIEKVQDNYKCANSAPNTGEVRVRIFKGGIEETDYSQYGFQWYTGPATAPVIINGATNYNLTGLAEGDYTALVRNVVKGCNGIMVDTTIIRTGVDPAVTIVATKQTLCNPPNGKLEATVAGGNTGYDFRWYDIGLNYLGIQGPVAANMVAGNYKLIVSKDGCTKQVDAPPIGSPDIPDAQAQVLQHVIDCLNPNSGSISADAIFNLAIQDPANYTFDWYFYNNATSTRGSILPPAYGAGQTRTGLPVGFYQVEITDNVTQCKANQRPIVEISSQTVLPTASISQVQPQTSCDPLLPNGILTASASGGSFVSPNDFTFEWFKGDNTLPANKVTTVSGVKGETVNQVAGGGVYYTVKVTTPNNCSDTEKFIIAEDINVPVVSLDSVNNTICDPALAASNYNGSVTSSVSFKGSAVTDFSSYQFTWHDGPLTSDPAIGGNTQSISQLDGGSYTLVVERTDLHCASVPVSIVVKNVTALPVIATDSIPSTNCVVVYNGNTIANGQVAVTAVDGVAPNANHSFLWSDNTSPTDIDGRTTSMVQNVQGGYIYTVLVTNKLTGCQNTANVQLPDASVVPVVSLSVLQPNGVCDPLLTFPPRQFNGRIGASFTTSSGNATDYRYTWRNVTDNIALGSTPPAQSGLPVPEFGSLNGARTYSVVAENTVLGCTSGAAQVFLPNSLALPVIKTDSIASTNCVLTYNGSPISNGRASVLTVDNGAPFTNYSFAWSDNGSPTPVNGSTTSTITQIQGGFIYTVQVTNLLTGCRNSDPVPLADASVIPVVTLAVDQPNTICNPALTAPAVQFNGRVEASFTTLSGNATDYQYTWRNVTDNLALGATPPTNTGPGVTLVTEFGGLNGNKDYSVVAVNTVLGCTSGAAQVFLPNATVLPVIKTDSIASTNCVLNYNGNMIANGQARVLTVNGAAPDNTLHAFLWSDNGSSTDADGRNTSTITQLQGGFTYTVQVTNKLNGCVSTDPVALPDASVIPVVTLAVDQPNTICNPALTVPPVQFNGRIEASFVTPSGNAADYKYTWRNETDNAALGATPPNNTGPGVTLVTEFGGLNGNRTYSVVAENIVLGCTSGLAQVVLPNATVLPVIETDSIPGTNCVPNYLGNPKSNGQVSVTSIDGGAPLTNYTFLWSGDGATPTPTASTATAVSNLEGGFQYTVTVTSKLTGCIQTHTIDLPDNQVNPVVAITKNRDNINCDAATLGSTGELEVVVSYQGVVQNDPGVVPLPAKYKLTWSNAATTETIASLAAGSYSVTVVDENLGCTSAPDSKTVLDAFSYPAIDIPVPTDQTSCNPATPNGAIQATVTGGPVGSTFMHRWFLGIGIGGTQLSSTAGLASGATTSLTNRAADDYTIHVRNQLTGCESVSSLPIVNNITYPALVFTGNTPVMSCNSPDGALTATLTNTSADFTIFYRNAQESDPAIITGAPTVTFDDVNPIYGSLKPGYVSAVVRNNTTQCESSPVTEQVIDNTTKSTINMTLIPVPGLCGGGMGGIDPTVGPLPSASYTFEWYRGAPTNTSPINFFDNLPTFSPATQIYGDGREQLGINGGDPAIGTGVYTLVIKENGTGCGAFLTDNVPLNNPPALTVTPAPVTRCDADNGALSIQVTGGAAATTYTLEVFDAAGPTNLITGTGPSATPFNLNVPNLDEGQYFVRLVDPNFPNCPMGQGKTIVRNAFDPLVSVDAVKENTECNSGADGDGTVTLTASADNKQVVVPDFRVTAISPALTGFAVIDIPENVQAPAISGFGSGVYTITVTDNNTGCFTEAVANVPDQPVLPEIFNVVADNDSHCAPFTTGSILNGSNGYIQVTDVGTGGPEAKSNFRFEWYTSSDVSVPANLVYEDNGDGPTTGELFNVSKRPASVSPPYAGWPGVAAGKGWSLGATPGEGNGNRTYFVRARRINGPSGIGCYTQLVQKDILDVHKTPDITLTPFANTSCDPAANAGEGVIRASTTIEADPRDGNVITATYTYTWNADPPGGNTSGVDGAGIAPGAQFDITALPTAGYTVTSVNAASGCAISSTANVITNPLPITLLSYTKQDQLMCNADGNIRVTEIEIDATNSAAPAVYTFATAANLVGNFDFQWFDANNDNDNNPATFNDAVSLGINDDILTEDGALTATPFPTMKAGTYYVIATRKPGMTPGNGCSTVPVRVDIIQDANYPVITSMEPFANTSCINGIVEGRIELAVNTVAPGVPAEENSDYDFTWIPGDLVNNAGGSGTANNVPNATAETLMTIPPGYVKPPVPPAAPTGPTPALKNDTYTVTALNRYSGCPVTGQVVVTPQKFPVTLISFTKQDQLICDPDGRITVTQVTIDGSTSNLPVYNYNTGAQLAANWDFKWFDANNDSDNNASTFNNTVPIQNTNGVITDVELSEDNATVAQRFATMGKGTYYVVATRKPGFVPGAGCSTAPVRVEIGDKHINPVITSLEAFANTSCDANVAEGRIELAVNTTSTVPAESGATYSYTWVQASPATNPTGSGTANNVANATATSMMTIPPGYTVPPPAGPALKDDTYTINVRNDYSKCTVAGQVVITPQKFPVTLISFTKQDQLICGPDGRITVTQVTIDGSTSNLPTYNFNTPAALQSNFDFSWYDANNDSDNNTSTFNSTLPIRDAANNPITAVVLSEDGAQTAQPFAAMGKGSYYVLATRKPGMSPGAGCKTLPVLVNIDDKHINPRITALEAFANTSCTSGIAEGRIELTVNTTSGEALESGSTYSYSWAPGNPASNPGGAGNALNVGNATATSMMTIPPGYAAPPAAGPALKDDTYTITVTNDYSKCTVTGQAVVPRQKYPITLISFTKQDQMICNPDGSISVTRVTIDGSTSNLPVYDFNTQANLIANFDFSWYSANNDGDNNPGTFNNAIPLRDATLTPITDVVLSEDAAITAQPFANMGAGTYYVLATRKPGMVPGAGCSTEPVRVDIRDLHTDPVVTFTHQPNTSCDPVNPNGVVVATAREQNGSIVDTYSFSWTLNGGALNVVTVPSTPDNRTGRLDDAEEGTYVVTATNTSNTGCDVTGSITVIKDLNISTPNIIDVATVDPVNCLPTASAEITSITIGGTVSYSINDTPPDDLDATFNYEWYKGTFAPGSIIAGEVNHDLQNILPDKYYVLVEDLSTACKSTPKEVVINADDIVYPQVVITQTELQVSCIATTGTAELQALADGQNDTNANYTFTWFRNLDTTPPSFQTGSTVSSLTTGEYSVSVLNALTGCTGTQLYIVPDDAPRFMPELSLSTEPRLNCLVNDGALLAREVGWNPNSGYPFQPNYSTEIYTGANADVTQPGTPIQNVTGFNRNWRMPGLDVGTYTVKITDNNTGCVVTGQESVADGRTPPVVVVMQDNPLTNCYITLPNGQLSATADNGRVGGYTFHWYRGDTANGTILQQNNKLIGETDGIYTVRVTNDMTGCFADGAGEIMDRTVKPHVPTPKVEQNRTHCLYPDGWVSASVEGVTFNYVFDWYNGATMDSSPDFNGINYTGRDVGPYTVTAMDVTTGCYSDPVTVEVADEKLYPELKFSTTPSFCEDVPSELNQGNGMIEMQLVPTYALSDSIVWTKEGDNAFMGSGAYITGLYPGMYHAEVTTVKGCTVTGDAEVKTEVLAYNLVTRNNDQKNDLFVIDCISRFRNNNVKIFNRSGVLVYEANGYNNTDVVFQGLGERGVYTTGNELPVGTYFYIIDKGDGSKPKTGYLELVK